jgi:hypothetical protein
MTSDWRKRLLKINKQASPMGKSNDTSRHRYCYSRFASPAGSRDMVAAMGAVDTISKLAQNCCRTVSAVPVVGGVALPGSVVDSNVAICRWWNPCLDAF